MLYRWELVQGGDWALCEEGAPIPAALNPLPAFATIHTPSGARSTFVVAGVAGEQPCQFPTLADAMSYVEAKARTAGHTIGNQPGL